MLSIASVTPDVPARLPAKSQASSEILSDESLWGLGATASQPRHGSGLLFARTEAQLAGPVESEFVRSL